MLVQCCDTSLLSKNVNATVSMQSTEHGTLRLKFISCHTTFQVNLGMHIQGKIADWWIPDDVAFVEEIPHTATGKVYKLKLRQQFKDFRFGCSKL